MDYIYVPLEQNFQQNLTKASSSQQKQANNLRKALTPTSNQTKMHTQALTLFAIAALAPAIQATGSGTFQAFNGYNCDGTNPGNLDTINGNARCIQMSGRHTFQLGGDLPNGAVVEYFPTDDCSGNVHHTETYYTGRCVLVNPGFSTHTVLVYTL
jgi:hypothetical protein